MTNNWQEATLKDVCLGIFDGPHATPQKTDKGPIYLSISSLVSGRLDLSQSARLSEKDFTKWTRRVTPQKDDLVFSYETRLGEAALIPDGLQCCLGRRLALMRPNLSILEPRFLLYYYLSPFFQDFIRSNTISGSTVDRILITEVPDFPIHFPSLSEQRAIAHILGALDDKIELNQRMNRTLEAMAQAIFKSWFVDFDPVVAKADGRQPYGMDAETAEFFPSDFQETRDGVLPTGWKFGSILNVADLLSGGTPKTSVPEYWDGSVPWVSAKDVGSANNLFLLSTERTITELGVQKSNAKWLPEKTTVITARGTVGKYCLLGRTMTMNQTNYGLKAHQETADYFVYFSLSFLVEQLQQNSYGTIFDTITTRTFESSQTILPTNSVIESFERTVNPLMELVLTNTKQSQILSSLRNALIPKLLSGDIRINQAEKLVEEVV